MNSNILNMKHKLIVIAIVVINSIFVFMLMNRIQQHITDYREPIFLMLPSILAIWSLEKHPWL